MRRILRPVLVAIAAAGCAGGGGFAVGCGSSVDSNQAASNPSTPAAITQADVPLVPRRLIFGNPDKAGPTLSDDGTKIAFRAEVDGVMNVWVGPADKPEAAKPITKDTSRGIR